MAIFTPFGIRVTVELLAIILTIATACWHAFLISHNRPIVHWVWASIFAAFVIAAKLAFGLSYVFCIVQAVGRLPVFNWSLDAFRGLSWRYESAQTGSIIDRLISKYLFIVELAFAILFVAAQKIILL